MDWLIGALGHALVTVVLPAAGTILTALVMNVIRKMAKKYDIEISDKNDQRLKQLVVDAIRMAEEMAHRAAKEGETVPGVVKKDFVIQQVVSAVKADPTMLPVSPAKVEAVLDSQLPIERPQQIKVPWVPDKPLPGAPNPGLPGGGKR